MRSSPSTPMATPCPTTAAERIFGVAAQDVIGGPARPAAGSAERLVQSVRSGRRHSRTRSRHGSGALPGRGHLQPHAGRREMGRHRDPARCHRTQAPGCRSRAHGAARRAHRAAQSHPAQRPDRAGDQERAAGAPADGRAAAGSRPLQGHQRHARSPGRRSPADRGRPAPAAAIAQRRHGRPSGRRRVRHSAARPDRPCDGLRGRAPGRSAAATVRDPGPHARGRDQHRRRALSHGSTAIELLQHADVAMYAAKRDQLGFVVYSPESDTNSVRS